MEAGKGRDLGWMDGKEERCTKACMTRYSERATASEFWSALVSSHLAAVGHEGMLLGTFT